MLALEINLSAIKSMFENRSKDIFLKNWFWDFRASKYQSNGIRNVYNDTVKKYLKNNTKTPEDLTFEDLKLPCSVSTFDIITNKVCWFSTQIVESQKIKLIDAVLSTSAAPTYFPIHSFVDDRGQQHECIDGGVWCNDPRLFCLFVERVINAQDHHERIYNAISFGTGQAKNKEVSLTGASWGSSISWMVGNPNIIDVMFEGSVAMIDSMFPYMERTGLVRSAKMQVALDTTVKLDDADSQNLQREQFKKNISNPTFKNAFDNAIRITWMMGVRGDEPLPTINIIQLTH